MQVHRARVRGTTNDVAVKVSSPLPYVTGSCYSSLSDLPVMILCFHGVCVLWNA
jgi:hypothetical protein